MLLKGTVCLPKFSYLLKLVFGSLTKSKLVKAFSIEAAWVFFLSDILLHCDSFPTQDKS